MEFISGIQFLDKFISDKSFEVIEKLTIMDENKHSHSIKKIIFHNIKHEFVNKKDDNNNSMVYDSNINIRIYIDSFVMDILTFIYSISKRFADKKCINNMIVGGWVYYENNRLKIYGVSDNEDECKYAEYEPLPRPVITIDKDIWEKFKKLAKERDISLQLAFKLAVIRFLEVRYEITTELYELDS